MGTHTAGSGPNVKQTVPLLAVSDIQRSILWYVDGLGFTITKRWVDGGRLRWCWMEHGEAALMLQEHQEPRTSGGKRGEGVTIYFICEDALAIYKRATSNGLQPEVPFVGNGMWVTMLSDPDGYRLGFESPTDAPEETQYAER